MSITFDVLFLYDVYSCETKIKLFSFYLLYSYEKESSFAWMTSYKNRMTRMIRSKCVTAIYFVAVLNVFVIVFNYLDVFHQERRVVFFSLPQFLSKNISKYEINSIEIYDQRIYV